MEIYIYQHDSPEMFRVVLSGGLAEAGARELRCTWETAKSTLKAKQLVLEVSAVTSIAPAGLDVLCRMRESGFRICAARLPECEELIEYLDGPRPANRTRPGRRNWAVRLLRALSFGPASNTRMRAGVAPDSNS